LERAVLSQAEILSRRHAILKDPKCLARFLCGVTSPKLTAAKLSSDPLFGVAADVPFTEVLAALGSDEPRGSRSAKFAEQEMRLVQKFIQDLGGLYRARLALEFAGEPSNPSHLGESSG
jgi:hypothetical protein